MKKGYFDFGKVKVILYPVLPLLGLKRIIIASTVPHFKTGKMSTFLASPSA
jgi:hypothetical protein